MVSLKKSNNEKIFLKNGKQIIRIITDLGMTMLLPLLMAYSLADEAFHEWAGIFMFLLFILHHILNLSWYKHLLKGRYSGSRILRTAFDLLLIPVMLILPISGIMMSRHIFLGLGGGLSFARTAHLLASYWGFVLMSLHIGLHWRVAVGMVGNLLHRKKLVKSSMLLFRAVPVFISLYGIYAFVHRQIGSYMFLKIQFVFFDFREARISFLTDYLAVMCLFAVCGYYAVRGMELLAERRKKA